MSAGAETNIPAREGGGIDRADAASMAAAGKLLAAYASMPGVMYGLKNGSDGRYIAASDSLAQFYGRPIDEVLGRNDTELLDPTLGAAMRAADQTALAHGRQLSSEHRFDWLDKKHDWEVLRVVTELGGRRVLACLWRDLAPQRVRESQLHAAIEQIEQHQIAIQQLRREFGEQLMRDSATGLATRANFEDQLRREVDLSTREHREFAMVLLELDADSARVAELGARAGPDSRSHGQAAARQHACDGRLVPPAGAALRGAAVGRRVGHGALANGRVAPPMCHADRGARRRGIELHRVDRGRELPAYRGFAERPDERMRGCVGRGAQTRRQHGGAGQHPLRFDGLIGSRGSRESRTGAMRRS